MGKFSDLPSKIVLDIFTRLPAESLLDCKSVSKTWRKVIHNPSFYRTHSKLLLSRLDSAAVSGKFSFILQMRDLSEAYTKRLYYLEYDAEVCSHRLRELNLNPPFESWGIIGSCNGLICINGLPNHYTEDESGSAYYVAFICNPITRECITLPEFDIARYGIPTYNRRYIDMSSGFGYVASTKEYKVVRVRICWDGTLEFEVYTLGSGKGWRNKGKINVDSCTIFNQHAKFVNGFLYWNLGNGKTVAFDLADEAFVGCSKFHKDDFRSGVLGGYLCATLYSKDGKSSDVWLLKKKEDESFRWSQELSLINTDPFTKSLAVTSSGAVLCYADTKLHLYDLKSSSSKMLEDLGRRIKRTIPHVNSFVSLKALGEANTKTLESGDSAVEDPNVEAVGMKSYVCPHCGYLNYI